MASLTSSTEPSVVGPSSGPHTGRAVSVAPSADLGFLPIPKRLRYDPEKPFNFGLLLNLSFGVATTFVMANLFYCQPLLIQLSKSFNVSYGKISAVPTLVQAGYATGLLLISPLGDLVRRRQLVLLLILASTAFTIGLAITPDLRIFEMLCYLVGVASVTPQILMPLAADLAAPERRASSLSVVFSGIMLGILVARVLAGVIDNFTTWRAVYYIAGGVQFLVLAGAYLVLPDYPAKNRDLSYFEILFTMGKYAVTEPLVIQAALINWGCSACFTSLWVTLTFLLGGPPYNYSTLDIGLFGLVGIFGVLLGPFAGRLIDNVVPWYATLAATSILLVFQSVQTAAGGISVAAVAIACFGIDVGRQIQQVSLSTTVLSISATARARLNAILILSLFVGQVTGTSVGTFVFVRYGWRACSLIMVMLYAFQLLVLVLRGPHCPRNHWFGWEGGFEPRKCVVEAQWRNSTPDDSTASPLEEFHVKTQEGLERHTKSGDAANAV